MRRSRRHPRSNRSTRRRLTDFLDAARPADRSESGFGEDVPVAFALRSGGEIVAAANLTPFRDEPTDVGVLTGPAHRGLGHGARVARAATAYAVVPVRPGPLPGARHQRSVPAIAAALGFEDRFDQLAIRPAPGPVGVE